MEIPAQQSNLFTTPEEIPFQHHTPDTIPNSDPYLEALFDPILQFPIGPQDTSDTFFLQNIPYPLLGWPQFFDPEVYVPGNTNWQYPLDCQQLATGQLSSTVYPSPVIDSILNSHQITHTQTFPEILPSLHQNAVSFTMDATAQYSETTAAKFPRARKKESGNGTLTPQLPGKRSRVKSEPTSDVKSKVKSEVKYDNDEESKGNKKQRVAPKFWSTEEDKALLDGVMEAMHGKWTIVAQHPDLANRDANRCTMRMKSIINRILKNPDRKD